MCYLTRSGFVRLFKNEKREALLPFQEAGHVLTIWLAIDLFNFIAA